MRRIDFGSPHWLDISGPTRADLEKLAAQYGMHPQMVADSLDPGHLPKMQREGGVSFLILRAYDEASSANSTTVEEITRKVAIFWGDGFLITVHSAALPWLNRLLDSWATRPGRDPSQITAAFNELVEEALFTYEVPIDHAAVAVENLEEEIFQDKVSPVTSHAILETAYLAKKRATLFKRVLRLSRDLLPQISKLGDPGSSAIQSLKEEADRLFFYSDDLVETANDLIELSISLTTNRTNEVVRMLTIVSIFILPLNLVTGIYGMNFEHMPELRHPYGYALTLVSMVAVVGLVWVLLKKKGWLR